MPAQRRLRQAPAARRDGFETEVFIAAPPEEVWRLLTEPDEHVGWNPSMRAIRGRFVAGGRVRLTMHTPGGGTLTFRPRILVADQPRELRWRGGLLLPRLFDGEQYFQLVPEEGGTRLIHGERFRGLALWAIDVQPFRSAFEAANAGLKRRAEATVAEAAA